MKKKTIIVSGIAGVLVLGLCAKFIVNNRDVPVMENAAVEESAVPDESNEQTVQEKTESEEPRETEAAQPERENQEEMMAEEIEELLAEGRQNKLQFSKRVRVVAPVVELNGERAKMHFHWDDDCIRVDADTLLFAIDCYFAEEKLQQKIFFLAEGPDFKLREVFRQDSKILDEKSDEPEYLEQRIRRPYPVEGGYVYELDGVLYFLDRDFKEISPLCNLRELMGAYYSFSVNLYYRICDVTADAKRMIACTDEGLYEYDLENGSRKLLESAYFAPHEIDENDCLCGQSDFLFAGPVRVEYGPDEQSYAYLTGTEEADWGDITGVVLRSGEGETLYQMESDNVYDFKWVKSEDGIYLAVFYTEKDEEGIVDAAWLMDRVDAKTGEVVTFEVPKEIYNGGEMCCIVGFLDADTLLCDSYCYRLSSGERQKLEGVGDVDWDIMVYDEYDYGVTLVRYPK